MDKLEKYKHEAFYHSDKQVNEREIGDIKDWDLHYLSGGPDLSNAEMAKTIELMSVLRDEIMDFAEDESSVNFVGSSLKREAGVSKDLEGVEIITIRNKKNPGFLLRTFKGGREDGKVKIAIDNERSEIDIIIQKDGNFLYAEEPKKDFVTEAFSTQPKDRAIGFKRMTADVTKQTVGIITNFLKSTSPHHRPTSPSTN